MAETVESICIVCELHVKIIFAAFGYGGGQGLVACLDFKSRCEAAIPSQVGSFPTHSRHFQGANLV